MFCSFESVQQFLGVAAAHVPLFVMLRSLKYLQLSDNPLGPRGLRLLKSVEICCETISYSVTQYVSVLKVILISLDKHEHGTSWHMKSEADLDHVLDMTRFMTWIITHNYHNDMIVYVLVCFDQITSALVETLFD